MNKLMEKKPIWHAVLWIMIYLVAVNIGDALSEQTGMPWWTGVLVLALSAVLVLYLRQNGRVAFYGLQKIKRQDARRTLCYLPLILLALIQFSAGVDPSLSLAEIAVSCLLMIGTGFVENCCSGASCFRGYTENQGSREQLSFPE